MRFLVVERFADDYQVIALTLKLRERLTPDCERYIISRMIQQNGPELEECIVLPYEKNPALVIHGHSVLCLQSLAGNERP